MREPDPICSCERDAEHKELSNSICYQEPVPASDVIVPPENQQTPVPATPEHEDKSATPSVQNEDEPTGTEDEEPSAEEDTVVIKQDSFDDAQTGVIITELIDDVKEPPVEEGDKDNAETEVKEEGEDSKNEVFKEANEEVEEEKIEVGNSEVQTVQEVVEEVQEETKEDKFEPAKEDPAKSNEEDSDSEKKDDEKTEIVEEKVVPLVNVIENETSESDENRTLSVEIESSDIPLHSDVSKLVEREIVDSDTSEAYLTPTERENDPVEIPQSVSDNLPESVHSIEAQEEDQEPEESESDKPVVSETCSNETEEPSCDITNVSPVSEHSEQDNKDPSVDQSVSEDKSNVELASNNDSEVVVVPDQELTQSPQETSPLPLPGSPQRVDQILPPAAETKVEHEDDVGDTMESPGMKF